MMIETKEIDVISLVMKVLKQPKTLMKFIGVAAIVGVVVALSIPKSYTASVVLAPEMSSAGLGMSESLGDLASSFGIDLGTKSGMDAIYPELYPEIFASTDFVLDLFPVKVRLKDDNSLKTYKEHLMKDSKMPFWSYPKVWLMKLLKKKPKGNGKGEKDPFVISEDDNNLCTAIRTAISCQVDKKTSVISISVTDQDPLVAAILADTLQLRLQEYITNYRTQKARNDYEYYKKLYVDSRNRYIKSQQLYASYSDANQDIVMQSFRAKLDELENEMQLCYNVYNQVSAQMTSAQAKIQERTPAFTVIEKAKMPHKASSMPRMFIVIMFVFLGCIADGLWVCFVKDFLKERKEKKSSK